MQSVTSMDERGASWAEPSRSGVLIHLCHYWQQLEIQYEPKCKEQGKIISNL